MTFKMDNAQHGAEDRPDATGNFALVPLRKIRSFYTDRKIGLFTVWTGIVIIVSTLFTLCRTECFSPHPFSLPAVLYWGIGLLYWLASFPFLVTLAFKDGRPFWKRYPFVALILDLAIVFSMTWWALAIFELAYEGRSPF